MKVGDVKAVTIDGIPVAQAHVVKVDGEIVRLEFPGTRVDFKVKMILTDESADPQTDTSRQTITEVGAPSSIVGDVPGADNGAPAPIATQPAAPAVATPSAAVEQVTAPEAVITTSTVPTPTTPTEPAPAPAPAPEPTQDS